MFDFLIKRLSIVTDVMTVRLTHSHQHRIIGYALVGKGAF